MPIDENEFNKYKNTLDYIIEFLGRNPDKAYTALEIAQALKMDSNAVAEALRWSALGRIMYRKQWPIEFADIRGTIYHKYNRKYRPGS